MHLDCEEGAQQETTAEIEAEQGQRIEGNGSLLPKKVSGNPGKPSNSATDVESSKKCNCMERSA